MKAKGYCSLFLSFLFWSFGFMACHKPRAVNSGDVSLLVYVRHHQAAIAYCKVFVKYNTLVFPGKDTSLYDTYKIADAEGFLRFDGLENGNKQLVLFASGFDPDWDTTHTTKVWGYMPIAINTALGENKETKVTIPVSE